MNLRPTKLELAAPNLLQIEWSDGQRRQYSCRLLRDACPCATCREKRMDPGPVSLMPILKPGELAPLTFRGMQPVGNYAYQIDFSDGHSTGIYTLESLRELGSEVPQ